MDNYLVFLFIFAVTFALFSRLQQLPHSNRQRIYDLDTHER
jgi:hypothetical protein